MTRHPDMPCALCGAMMWRGRTSLPAGEALCRPCRLWISTLTPPEIIACPVCGTEFVKRPDIWTCSRRCGYIKRSRNNGGNRLSGRICSVCGATYNATYADQVTCGRACGAIQQRLNAGTKPRTCPIDIHPCRRCGRLFTRVGRVFCSSDCRAYIPSQPVTRDCTECGAPHTTLNANNQGRCKKCQRRSTARAARQKWGRGHRARARRYGVEYEPINRVKVYKRDAWRCGLCGRKVSPNLKSPHPLSPSLDHVVPMSLGGGHVYANVQLAHFICNSMKGAGGSQQLALVG